MKLSKRSLLGGLSVMTVLGYVACTHNPPKSRFPSGDYAQKRNVPPSPKVMEVLEHDAKVWGGKVRFTPGLTMDETIELWHLSEGSEVFPLAWMIRMKSQFSNLAGTTHLHESLDKKFGVIAEDEQIANRSPYPFKWVGVTAAWSEGDPTNSDVKLDSGASLDEATIVQKVRGSGNPSIAMVGVNCAFCHSNEIKMNGKTHFFEGAPGMINIRGFFQDMFATTAKTMLTPELLEEFLVNSKVQGNLRAIAEEFVTDFKKEMGIDTFFQKTGGAVINFFNQQAYSNRKATTVRKALFEKRDVVQKYLERLLMISYGIDKVPNELKFRMKFLAFSMGADPDLAVTPEGYSRTDAFGRIANLVARTKNPIPLTATASVPPMWNIEYKSLFHWNANTNSVVMRNLGQSFGLGAILTNPNGQGLTKYDATVNLHNLLKLEELLYKIQTPRFEQISSEIDIAKALEGCNVFHTTCAGCHMPEKQRVGPRAELINYKIIPQDRIGTDAIYNHNQAQPVEGQPFKTALFDFTKGVRSRYYERYNVPEEQQHVWQKTELRGEELFRDTSLGESGHTGTSTYMNIAASPVPGFPARHLAGVWATAPYLHNGSVPDIYELLKPSDKRTTMFFVGSREYDGAVLGFRSDIHSVPEIPGLDQKAQALLNSGKGILSKIRGKNLKAPANILEAKVQVVCATYPERCMVTENAGNSKKGHEFGTRLPYEQKMQLIEFLKVLRPEPEYSFNGLSPYKWDDQTKTCVSTQ